MEKPLFFTKLSKLELISSIFCIGIGLLLMIFFGKILYEKFKMDSLFLFLAPVFLLIQVIRIAKTFIVYNDRIVIRRPFAIFKKEFDVVYKLNELKDVTFRTVKARAKNDFVIFHTKVSSNKSDESYVLNDRIYLKLLMSKLESLGVKTINELE
ncbi:MAG: hypothetical protein ACOVNP_07550 [Flavobacterium sp.]